APHLDLEPCAAVDLPAVEPILQQTWLDKGLETRALAYAGEHIVPGHYEEISHRRQRQIERIHVAVRTRLIKEINHLNHRAAQLDVEVSAGRQPRMQPDQLRRRADDLTARLEARERELEQMRHIVAMAPAVVGGAVVIPAGLLAKLKGGDSPRQSVDPIARARIEQLAMDAVMATERNLGHQPRDVSADKCGWDITSRRPPVD